MSFAEIVKELPKLDRNERRELARWIFDFADEEAALLAECDQSADERFLMLEEMEAQDGKPAHRAPDRPPSKRK